MTKKNSAFEKPPEKPWAFFYPPSKSFSLAYNYIVFVQAGIKWEPEISKHCFALGLCALNQRTCVIS